MKNRVDVFPPHGFVELKQYVGEEIDIVNAARVSFHNESELSDGELTAKDKGLINFLLKNKHGSPFEQGFMSQWHIRLPIFVMRELVRHRIGFSINEESGRYVEMRPDFYIPTKARVQHGKPGAYTYEELDREAELTQLMQGLIYSNGDDTFSFYKTMIKNGIAKEQARLVLPLNLYTEIRWTANARSLLNFFELRSAPEAMYEIRKYSEAIERIFAFHMPNVHESFVNNERTAP